MTNSEREARIAELHELLKSMSEHERNYMQLQIGKWNWAFEDGKYVEEELNKAKEITLHSFENISENNYRCLMQIGCQPFDYPTYINFYRELDDIKLEFPDWVCQFGTLPREEMPIIGPNITQAIIDALVIAYDDHFYEDVSYKILHKVRDRS